MQRREFLTLGTATAFWLLSGCQDRSSSTQTYSSNTPLGELPIPPLLEGKIRSGVTHYDLTISASKHRFFDGIETQTWGISSSYLGPTLKIRRGSQIAINYNNRLNETTTMHAHGLHINGSMDGSTHQPIAPGAQWSAQTTVNQPAATLWYHPHYLHRTAPHVYQGLAGLIIVEDEESSRLDLPKRYGIDDIPLVLQDRIFSSDKTQLLYQPNRMQLMRGYIGDYFMANGAISPTFRAEATMIRLRLLNGSNSTVYTLGFGDGRQFVQIAGDNGFLPQPVTMGRLTLSPGERAEVIVDFTGDMGSLIDLHEYRHNRTFVRFSIEKDPEVIASIPFGGIAIPAAPAITGERRFVLGMGGMQGGGMGGGMGRGMGGGNSRALFTINGKSMDPNRIDFHVPRGGGEIWEVINPMPIDHNFHLHGTSFRILSRNDNQGAVAANEQGWKDTLYLPARSRAKLLVDFTLPNTAADSANPYMFHCHFLEHEDNGMMGQYTVG